jgi:hypothetical protein
MDDREREELIRTVRKFVDERLEGTPGKPLKVDIVNLDRGGEAGLVYLNGAIVTRGDKLLDGLHRLHAIVEAGKSNPNVSIRQHKIDLPADLPDPVEGATYVKAGPTPSFVVDRENLIILLDSKGQIEDDDARMREILKAAEAALVEYFGQ